MRGTSRNPFLGLLLSGLLVAASCIAASSPVSAQHVAPPPGPPDTSGGGGINGRDVGIAAAIALGIVVIGAIIHNMNSPPPPPPDTGPELGPAPGPIIYEPSTGPLPGNQPPSGPQTDRGNGNRSVTRNEPRFVPDEVVVQFSAGTSPQLIDQIARRYNLTRLDSQSLPLIGTTLYRLHIIGGRSVPSIVGALRNEGVVAGVQPNYLFALQQQAPESPAGTQGDPAQYVLSELQIQQAHQMATGKGVLVAVIDSEIDETHPDLDGAIAKSFDALGGQANPHLHGTAMAGAIASHGKLLGIAPGVQLLAERAFNDAPGEAQGTSFAIYRSLQWAADNNARVVNMSFAGPPDPTLHRLLTAAYQKGLVLIAAAGNAGPKSPPLYPAADPDVIAVTATDSNDHVFKMANRGRYVAVAAPGVDILALAPDGSYGLTTGTSVAAAEVSGIAALVLERKPALKPSDVRAILTASAKPLGPKSQSTEFGAGLVNAYQALLQEAKSVRLGVGEEHAGR
jgi:subtilisin family serine protease